MQQSEKIRQAIFAAELNADIPTLDLHQPEPHTKTEAIQAIETFIGKYGTKPVNEIEVLKIITGRGSGTLYRNALEYCKKHPRIAYTQGSDRLDQSGAVIFIVMK